MSFRIAMTPGKDQLERTVFTVAVTISGEPPVSRTFPTKDEAEQYEAGERSRLLKCGR